MRAINHALTGALIGLAVGEPSVAVPAAVASHFVCDAIPHYDGLPARPTPLMKQRWIHSKLFKKLLVADAALCLVLVAVLADLEPAHWLLAAVCAFAAAAPDFLWIPRFLARKAKPQKLTGFNKFAGGIQWFQRPIGAVVEVAWFIAAIILIAPFLA
ncbi:MAG TPA: hypothetical protein VLG27_00220 [Candidatus Saccharimonadia bacterium]|nr:hypothetical protein [Candidatus Saccharimonadia bacterium]